ncbi:hypothetical protein ScPMuIL_012739 [Solemya velum]
MGMLPMSDPLEPGGKPEMGQPEVVSVKFSVDVSKSREKRSTTVCPDVAPTTIGRGGKPIVLQLIRNTIQPLTVPLTIFDNGDIQHRQAQNTVEKCLYQDEVTESSVVLLVDVAGSPFEIRGTFFSEQQFFEIEPRKTAQENIDNPHIIRKLDTVYDYEGDAVYPDSPDVSNHTENQNSRVRRETPGKAVHLVEVVAVIDSLLWKRFYSSNNEDTTLAESELTTYYILVGNSMDLHFKSIGEQSTTVDIRVAIVEIIIQKEISDSSWSLGNAITEDNVYYIALDDDVHPSLVQWTAANKANFQYPGSDHTMGFTGADLNGTTSGIGLLGRAYLDAVCSTVYGHVSVSIIENRRVAVGPIAAHELGHALSARHDGTNSCDDSQYLMSPSVSNIVDEDLRQNPWMFSTCSVAEFENYLSSPTTTDCTQDHVSGLDPISHSTERQLGEIYSRDQQCVFSYGDIYKQYGGDNSTAICYDGIKCSNYSVIGGYYYYFNIKAFSGTECATGKWCQRGFCVTHPNCIGVTCQNGGACVHGIDSYACDCLAGFEGDHCETSELLEEEHTLCACVTGRQDIIILHTYTIDGRVMIAMFLGQVNMELAGLARDLVDLEDLEEQERRE